MKTMQEMKDNAYAAVWHRDRRAGFCEASEDFSQEDIGVSGLNQRKGGVLDE